MSVEVANLLQPEIAEMLRAGNMAELRSACSELHAADLEAVIALFDRHDQVRLFEALDPTQQPDVFGYFPFELQQALLESLSVNTRTSVLNGLSPDDRAKLFDALDDGLRTKLLSELSIKERQATLAVLDSDEHTAGRLMTPEYLWVNAGDTVESAFEKVRRESEHVETIYVVYVVQNGGTLVGTVSLRELLRARPADLIRQHMTEDPVHVTVDTHQEEAATVMKRYDLIALPVVDESRKLVGIVTFDDIHDVVDQQASEDILRMHGIATQSDSYFDASIGKKLRQRIVVLVSLAGVSFVSVLVQREYNHLVAQVSILAVYLSMLMGSSGNCGTQVSGIIIRAQTLTLEGKKLTAVVSKEIAVGALMAAVMASVASGLVLIFGADERALGGHPIGHFALIVGIAMFVALTVINVLGGIMPLVMKRFGLDPAITAGPFITTMADIMTVLIYFNIALLMLKLL
ncbi:MAG: magnesium transporter [Planctomycetaceae bacterium]|nr:magnesium transporter [Planctomycetaceae bacterium]